MPHWKLRITQPGEMPLYLHAADRSVRLHSHLSKKVPLSMIAGDTEVLLESISQCRNQSELLDSVSQHVMSKFKVEHFSAPRIRRSKDGDVMDAMAVWEEICERTHGTAEVRAANEKKCLTAFKVTWRAMTDKPCHSRTMLPSTRANPDQPCAVWMPPSCRRWITNLVFARIITSDHSIMLVTRVHECPRCQNHLMPPTPCVTLVKKRQMLIFQLFLRRRSNIAGANNKKICGGSNGRFITAQPDKKRNFERPSAKTSTRYPGGYFLCEQSEVHAPSSR